MTTTISTFSTAALILFLSAVANGQTEVFTDTFDAAPTNGATRVFSPDNTANNGTFPGSAFDVFGIVDRNVNFVFADDSLSIFPGDTFGIIPEGKTDFFLGFQDTVNDDNLDGNVSLTWTVSTAGLADLNLSFEIAAMGNFEEPEDRLEITASFDGGAEQSLFVSGALEGDTATYILESGTEVMIVDPFAINGQQIINEFQTFDFPISGSGSNLTLTLTYIGNGGDEIVAIDNVSVTSGGGGGTLKGDVNLSGVVDFLDISPFISILGSGGFSLEADVNCDEVVDFLDIQPFISVLANNQ